MSLTTKSRNQAALRQIESMFQNLEIPKQKSPTPYGKSKNKNVVIVEDVVNENCDVHGKKGILSLERPKTRIIPIVLEDTAVLPNGKKNDVEIFRDIDFKKREVACNYKSEEDYFKDLPNGKSDFSVDYKRSKSVNDGLYRKKKGVTFQMQDKPRFTKIGKRADSMPSLYKRPEYTRKLEHPADFPNTLRRSDFGTIKRDKQHIPLHDTKFTLHPPHLLNHNAQHKKLFESSKPKLNLNNNSIFHQSSYKDVGRIPDLPKFGDTKRDYVNRKLSNDSLDSGLVDTIKLGKSSEVLIEKEAVKQVNYQLLRSHFVFAEVF